MLTRVKELSETHRVTLSSPTEALQSLKLGRGRLERELREKMLAIVEIKYSLGL